MTKKPGTRRPFLLRISHPKVREFLAVPKSHPWLFLGPIAVCCGIALAAILLSPKRYTSTAVILVETKRAPGELAPKVKPPKGKRADKSRLMILQQEVLKRSRVERVIRDTDAFPQKDNTQPAIMNSLVESVLASALITPKTNDAFSIDYTHNNPKKAQAVANRLVSLFIESTKEDKEKQAEDATDFIQAQVAEARKQLDEKEAELRRYKEKYMGALPEQLGANLSTLQRLQAEQQTVEQTIRGLSERQTLIQMNPQTTPTHAPHAGGGENQASSNPAVEIAQLKIKLADLRSRYTDEHPDVRATLDRLERLEAQLPAGTADPTTGQVGTMAKELQSIQAELVQARAKSADLERQVGLFQGRVERTPQAEQQLKALTVDHEKLQQNYLFLVETRMKAELEQNKEKWWSGAQISVLAPASLPARPSFPNPVLFGVGGLIIGLLAGLGSCFLAEFLDRSIKSVADLEEILPYPVLGTVARITPLGITEGLAAAAQAGDGSGEALL